MSLDKVWLSFIDYRPDPGMPEKERIALGCILEARLGDSRELSLTTRVELTEPELRVMDGIGREMLARPMVFLDQEVRRFLERPSGTVPFEEGGVLRALSREHLWSVYVTHPRLIRIERHLSQTNREALGTANEELFIAHMLGKEVPLTRPLRAKRIVPDDWRALVPPAWQIAHSSLAAPARPRV